MIIATTAATRYILSTFAALLLVATTFAQSPGSISGSRVMLNVLVTNKSHQPVVDLNQDEFIVLEEGKPQTLTFFETREIPVTVGLLIDTTGSMKKRLKELTLLTSTIVMGIKPDDKAFIARMTANETSVITEWTSDRTDLLKAISTINDATGATALIDSVHACSEYLAKYEKWDLPDRRRAVVIISDGAEGRSGRSIQELVTRLQSDNIQVFTIAILPSPLHPEMDAFGRVKLREAASLFEKLTKETGGRSFYPESEPQFRAAGTVVGNYLHKQYVVGYVSTNNAKKGSFRNVSVKLSPKTNRESLIVTARLHYVR
jgi:VWFA-related protein